MVDLLFAPECMLPGGWEGMSALGVQGRGGGEINCAGGTMRDEMDTLHDDITSNMMGRIAF